MELNFYWMKKKLLKFLEINMRKKIEIKSAFYLDLFVVVKIFIFGEILYNLSQCMLALKQSTSMNMKLLLSIGLAWSIVLEGVLW